MPAKPTDKRTAVGRNPAASVQGNDVCALVADRRFASPAGEDRDRTTEGASPAADASPEQGDANTSEARADTEPVQQGRSNNDKGYQESPDDRRRAPADQNAAENPALLHRARSSASGADSSLAKPPSDRRR